MGPQNKSNVPEMQIPRIWKFLEAHMTRTLQHSKKFAVHSLPITQAAPWAVFHDPTCSDWCLCFVCLWFLVVILLMPFSYTCVAISEKENDTWPPLRTSALKSASTFIRKFLMPGRRRNGRPSRPARSRRSRPRRRPSRWDAPLAPPEALQSAYDLLYIKSIDRSRRNYTEIQNQWRVLPP